MGPMNEWHRWKPCSLSWWSWWRGSRCISRLWFIMSKSLLKRCLHFSIFLCLLLTRGRNSVYSDVCVYAVIDRSWGGMESHTFLASWAFPTVTLSFHLWSALPFWLVCLGEWWVIMERLVANALQNGCELKELWKLKVRYIPPAPCFAC